VLGEQLAHLLDVLVAWIDLVLGNVQPRSDGVALALVHRLTVQVVEEEYLQLLSHGLRPFPLVRKRPGNPANDIAPVVK
jgi:hypothetical protein